MDETQKAREIIYVVCDFIGLCVECGVEGAPPLYNNCQLKYTVSKNVHPFGFH